MDNVVIPVKADFVMGPRRKSKAQPTVFLAYRMKDQTSRAMRTEFSQTLARRKVAVVDGHVPDGSDWAPEVRRRIQASKLVVADLTGTNREVLFEFGFAGNTATMPVVHKPSDRAGLPRWITATQIPTYESVGLAKIVDSVATRLVNGGPIGRRRRPPPVPGRATWIGGRNTEWADATQAAVKNLCAETGVTLNVVDGDSIQSPEELRDLERSWLVIGCVDGGNQDYVVHYLMGDIVGRRRAGAGPLTGQSIPRSGFILVSSETMAQQLVADSVRRVERKQVGILYEPKVVEDIRATLMRFQAHIAAH